VTAKPFVILILKDKRKEQKGLLGSNMAAKWEKSKKEVVGGATPPASSEPERITNKLEHTLVAESKYDRKQVWKTRAKKVTSHKRFKPAVIVLVVLVVAASLLAFLAREGEEPVADTGPKCNYQVLEATKPNLNPQKVNVKKLKPQVAEIEQIPGYDTDVNCLYVTAMFYIYTSDVEPARRDYDKLAAIYDAGEGYARPIDSDGLPPERLKSEVEFLEKQAEKVEVFVSPPVEEYGGDAQ
jgi:hypothetical protein